MKNDDKNLKPTELNDESLSVVTGGVADDKAEKPELTVSDDILISKYSGTEVDKIDQPVIKDETMLIIPIV